MRRKGNTILAVLAGIGIAALSGSGGAAADFTVKVEKIAPLTGPHAPADMKTPDICGTDLGTMTELGDRLYFAFGDTFGFKGLACPRFGPNWRSNVLAYTTDKNATDGIALEDWHTDETGKAIAVTEGAHQAAFTGNDGEQTRIPTAMVTVGHRIYLHFMSVHGFAARGGEWDCNFSRFIYSDDGGETWTQNDTDFGDRNAHYNMLALSASAGRGNADGRYVYAIGTACGRFGPAYAARVEAGDLLNTSAWEYFDGTHWAKDRPAANPVIPPVAGEGSLVWNAGLGKWMYTTLNQNAGAILLYLADDPWGPWGEVADLARSKNFPQLYGAFMSPALISNDGHTFYFIMSQFGPYNAYLMRANLNGEDN